MTNSHIETVPGKCGNKPVIVRHIFRFRWACPSGATTGQLQPTAQNQTAEREGHHHAGGMPRPDHPVRGILTSAGARSTSRSVSVSKTCRSTGTSQARPKGVRWYDGS